MIQFFNTTSWVATTKGFGIGRKRRKEKKGDGEEMVEKRNRVGEGEKGHREEKMERTRK